MKSRTSRELNNIILSIISAIQTFLKLFEILSNFLKNDMVDRYEFFFLKGHKNCRVGTKKKNRVGRVSGNTVICFRPKSLPQNTS